MSAMLEFYDDGEECDETTEEDLEYLKDVSTRVNLGVTFPPILGIYQKFLHLPDEDRQRLFKKLPEGIA